MLIASAIYFFCCPAASPTPSFGGLFMNSDSIWFWLTSVFYRPNILTDLFKTNTCIYPALMEMNRIVPRLGNTSITFGNVNVDYTVAVLFLIFGIGGSVNWITTRVTKRPVYGFFTTVAASLSYYQRMTRARALQTFLLYVLGQPVTPATAYFTGLAMLVLSSNGNWLPPLLAWILAGCAGSLFGQYHLENQVWWGNVVDVFRIF
jgi:hypothetical protein